MKSGCGAMAGIIDTFRITDSGLIYAARVSTVTRHTRSKSNDLKSERNTVPRKSVRLSTTQIRPNLHKPGSPKYANPSTLLYQ